MTDQPPTPDPSSSDEKVQKLIRIPSELAERFDKLYPQYGAWTWFLQTALEHFLALHTYSPDELIKVGVAEMIEDT